MTRRLDYNAIAPQGLKALGGVYGYIQKSGLSGAIIDLAYLRASQINGCAYCIDLHARDLLKSGMSVDKLLLVPVWRDVGDLFDVRERAALAWTEAVTRIAETGAPDADYVAALEVFGEKALVDLTLGVAMMNAYNRMAISFHATPQGA